jgi:hypothetical protein
VSQQSLTATKKGQRESKRFNSKACEEINTAYSNTLADKDGGLLSLKDSG